MLNVAYCCSDEYASYVGISMLSCIVNNFKKFNRIIFHIILYNVSTEHKNKLKAIVKNYYNCEIKFYDFDYSIPDNNLSYPPIVYAPLFLSKLINEDEIIFIDADTLILNHINLSEDFELNENYCCAVLDIPTQLIKKHLNFSEHDYYFNSGFLYFNLKKIRNNPKIFDKIMFEIHKGYPLADQDILNIIFKDKIKLLPVKYNLWGMFYELDYEHVLKLHSSSGEYYSKDEIDKAKQEVVCHHFINLFCTEPWKDKTNPFFNEFKYYADLTPFDDSEIYIKSNLPLWKRVLHKLMKKIPVSVYFPLAKGYMTKMLNNKFNK